MNITITRNGQKYGPYTIEELTQYVNEGSILLDDYAYNGAEWVTVSQLFNDLNTTTIANDSNSYGTGGNSAVLLKTLKWVILSVVVFFGVYHLSTFVLENTYVEMPPVKKDPSYNPPDGAVEYRTLEKRDGILYKKGSDDLYSGVVYQLHESGKKKIEGKIAYGLRNGYEVSWYQNGEEKHRGTYRDDLRNGEMILYYENGKERVKVNYKNDKVDGLVAAWYENGMERTLMVFDSDTPNGIAQFWYENGQMFSDGRMEDGNPVGALKAWHENGNKWLEVNDVEGKDLRTVLLLSSEGIWNKEGELVDAASLEGIKEVDSYLKLIGEWE